ncbi:MAG: ABC-F family ATP-binding cassette domain-containing protein [Lachnospiraceae bacterium]|nr:ABC-F family ATP-binding cassette domain-containing protein [Lachnospiraceae bacterium]
MNILNIENLSKSYTERKLFDCVDFSLQEGEKVGIIGINGTGKSTLLKILAGEEEADDGVITVANHVVLRYLPQHPVFDPEKSSLECVLKGNVTEENRWTVESDAKTMMTRLGITDFSQPAGQLSGGQRKRLALISVLLSPADIILLDEPTNHLDNSMADWLEEYLKKWRGSLIMVTHDRYFLDSVCNRIIEIDKGKIYSYQTNYSGFLELKTQRQEMELASERKRQSILRVELEWMQRGARARSTKQKAHIQRYEELRDRKGPEVDARLELSSISTRLGRTTVELEQICKSYGDRKLIDDFSYIFLKGDRVGFIGPNGCGKSTLMKIIAGLMEPDSGQVIVGQTVKIGYYAQEISYAAQDENKKVIEYIKDIAEYIRTADGLISASAMLEQFLFPPEKQYSPISKLSGGEKRRLNLLRVIAGAPNVLVLDELTNDLDITTLTILEDYLDTYEGIVIAVSHDRYFLDRTMRRIFAYESDGKLRQYEGGYTDYALRKDEEACLEAEQAPKSGNEKTAAGQRSRGPQKLKMSYKEQREYETIEDEIASLEERLEEIEAEIGKNARDYTKLNQLMAEKEEKSNLLEEKMDRWMYLEELAAKIADQ